MINLTLPKWLQPKDSVREKPQTTHDDSINNNLVEPALMNQESPSSTHRSLTYLDDYIHHWF